MFRDLKEYHEIAKIYADKVSKPKDLEENRNQMAMKLRQEREANKPPETPKVKSTYQSNRDKLNKSRTELNKGRAEKQFSVLKPKPRKLEPGQTSVRKSGVNDSRFRDKKIDKQVDKYVADRKSDTPIRKIDPAPFNKREKADPQPKDKEVTQTPPSNKKPKMGSPDSKFIRREKGKGPGFVKRGTPGAQRAENQEKARNRAKEMAKARIAAKAAEMKEGSVLQSYIKPTMPLLKDKSGNFYTTDGKPFDMEKFKDNYNKNKNKTDKTDVKSSYEYDAYDLVLEYLLSTEQAATIEEANYVMTEMDAETIQAIVKEGSMDVPADVKAAAKRQYKAGSPGADPYTVDDKKTIINYYKNKKGKV